MVDFELLLQFGKFDSSILTKQTGQTKSKLLQTPFGAHKNPLDSWMGSRVHPILKKLCDWAATWHVTVYGYPKVPDKIWAD